MIIERHLKAASVVIPSEMDANMTTTEEYPKPPYTRIDELRAVESGQIWQITIRQSDEKNEKRSIVAQRAVSWKCES